MFNINLLTAPGLQKVFSSQASPSIPIQKKVSKNTDMTDDNIKADSHNVTSANFSIFLLILLFFILLMACSIFFKGNLSDFNTTINKIYYISN